MFILSVFKAIENVLFGVLKFIFFPQESGGGNSSSSKEGLLNSSESFDLYHETLLPKAKKSYKPITETLAVLILLICLLNFSI